MKFILFLIKISPSQVHEQNNGDIHSIHFNAYLAIPDAEFNNYTAIMYNNYGLNG